MRMLALILSLLTVAHTATADDLDVIVDRNSTAQARGEAYRRLIKADFTTYVRKLTTLMVANAHDQLSGIGPSTKEPWNEERLYVGDRIMSTLHQLWGERTFDQETKIKIDRIMLEMVEDDSLGLERISALEKIRVRLDFAGHSPTGLPPLNELHSRLERIARDEKQPLPLRRLIVRLIFFRAQLDRYLDLAVDLASKEPTTLDKAYAFCEMTAGAERNRFTEEANKRYVTLYFDFLESTNERRSGDGYHLATALGRYLGIRELEDSHGPFGPKRSLPKYQKGDYKTNGYFQDTVDNAMKWWAENKGGY